MLFIRNFAGTRSHCSNEQLNSWLSVINVDEAGCIAVLTDMTIYIQKPVKVQSTLPSSKYNQPNYVAHLACTQSDKLWRFKLPEAVYIGYAAIIKQYICHRIYTLAILRL